VWVKLLWLRRRGVGARGEPRHERQAPPGQQRLDEHRPRPRGARAPLPARRTRPGHPTSAIARRVRCSSTTGSGGCPGFASRPTRLPRATRPRPRDQLRRCALARLRGSRDEGVALQRELRRPSLGANRQGAVPKLSKITVDRSSGLAHVGGGALNQDILDATVDRGLILPGGTCLGVGGLVLGGGIGYNTHRAGLTSDHLRSSPIALASGEALNVDGAHHRDLFWACRGGAGGSGDVGCLPGRPGPMYCPRENVSIASRRPPGASATEAPVLRGELPAARRRQDEVRPARRLRNQQSLPVRKRSGRL
jgi:hypothetical protein